MNTEMEFQLMKVLWSLKHATTAQVRERYNELNETSLAYTTAGLPDKAAAWKETAGRLEKQPP